MDWQDTLERAIPQAPPTQTNPSALVAEGKRRVRRRQIVTGSGAALAAAAVIVGTVAVLTPIADRAAPAPEIAVQPSPTTSPSVVDEELPPLTDNEPLRYSFETGKVDLAKGWRVTDRVSDPTGKGSIAFSASNGRGTYFALLTGPDGTTYGEPAPTTSFTAWIASTKATEEAMAIDPQPDIVDGELRLSHGWRAVREVPNPMEYTAPRASVGAVIERQGTRKWIMVASDGDGGNSSHESQPTAGGIESWLPGVVAQQRQLDGANGVPSTPIETDPVSFGTGERLVAAPGVRIREQVASPDLGPDFAPANARTAAAKISTRDGERYVVVRELEGVTEVIPRSGEFDTLADFVAFAKRQYANGTGLR